MIWFFNSAKIRWCFCSAELQTYFSSTASTEQKKKQKNNKQRVCFYHRLYPYLTLKDEPLQTPVSVTFWLPFQYTTIGPIGERRAARRWWMTVDVIWFSFEPQHQNLLRLINLSVCFHLAGFHIHVERRKRSEAAHPQHVSHIIYIPSGDLSNIYYI